VTGTNTCVYDSVVGAGLPARTGTTVRAEVGHKCPHLRVRVLNFSTRVLPVSPKIRITY
jgi:hypothetical protein